HDLHRLLVSREREDLRSDVRMQSDELESRVLERLLYRLASAAGLDREAELRVELPGGYVVVRVGLDARRYAQHDRSFGAGGHDLIQEVELLEAVDHDRGARAVRGPQVAEALVVAQEMNSFGGEIGAKGEVELAFGHDVEAESLLRDNPQELRRRERFGRVQNLTRPAHRGHVLSAALA